MAAIHLMNSPGNSRKIRRASRRALDNVQGSPFSFNTFLPNSLCPTHAGHYLHPNKPVLSHLCASPLHRSFQTPPSSPCSHHVLPTSQRLPVSPLGEHRCAPGGSGARCPLPTATGADYVSNRSLALAVFYPQCCEVHTITVVPILQMSELTWRENEKLVPGHIAPHVDLDLNS